MLISLSYFEQGAVIGIDDEDDSTFTITVDQKTFHFQGTTLSVVSFQTVNCNVFVFSDKTTSA